MELILQNKRQAFPALWTPQAFGDGEPAYGNKLIIDPTDPDVARIKEAMLKVAQEKWKDDGANVLKLLIEQRKVCFIEGEYRNQRTGLPYDGFEGKFYLSTRNAKVAPTVKDKFNNDVLEGAKGAPYSGCFVHAAVDIWAQDNQYGRRINCTLQGIMYANEGTAFAGGRPADDNTFANLAAAPETADFC